jgi:hypothetical protein
MTTAQGTPFEAFLHRLVDDGEDEATSYLVRRVPEGDQATLLREIMSPLVAAWARSSRVFSCWTHAPGSGFEVRVGGTHDFPVAPGDDEAASRNGDRKDPRPILFPPGARADYDGPAAPRLSAVLGPFTGWRRVGGFVERRREAGEDEEAGALEDHASFLSHMRFALLCVAVPVGREAIGARRAEVAARLLESQRGLDRGAADRVTAALTAEIEECTVAEAAGLWRVHLFAGAETSDAVDQVAGIWGASTTSPSSAVYRLAPVGEPQPLTDAAARVEDRGQALALASPFHAGSRYLAAVCRPPLVEVPGVEARAINPFDVAVGTARGATIAIGKVLDRSHSRVGELRIPLRTLGMHSFVHGATGAGKSQATRHMLTEFTRQGIPWIVLEPAKSEYAVGMTKRLNAIRGTLPDASLADVYVVRPGDPRATPVSINPLQPEMGSHHQAHLDVLVDLATAAFDASSPFPEVLTQAVNRSALAAGWDPALSLPLQSVRRISGDELPPFADVADLVRACHEVIDEKGYGREAAGNVHGFVDMRLGTLTTGAKRVAFSAGYPLSFPAVLEHNVVLELQDLGTDADRALFMGLFLARFSEAVNVRHKADPLSNTVRNVVCIEEAHRLLRNPENLEPAAARAVESFTDLLAEVRSLGVALLVAEQIPSKISSDVVKNTAFKCMGRTPAQDDRIVVGATMGLTEEQSEQVVSLSPGQFAVHADGFDRPFLVEFEYYPDHDGVDGKDPAALVDPLPKWYGREVARPGGLNQGDVALAEQLATDPAFALLCELVVVGHLTGRTFPTVRPDMRSSLLQGLAQDAPAVRAAIGQAVGEAAKSRASVFGRYTLPAFATTAAEQCVHALIGGHGGVPDRRWMSRPYQFIAINDALKSRAGQPAPHPETSRWIKTWRLDFLDHPTIEAQHEGLRRSLASPRTDLAVANLGRARPSRLEAVAKAARPGKVAAGLRVLTRFAQNTQEIEPLLVGIAAAANSPKAAAADQPV